MFCFFFILSFFLYLFYIDWCDVCSYKFFYILIFIFNILINIKKINTITK